MKSLSIVLKTVERCNLNCTYCYFFNGLDKSYLKRPKFISKETIDNITNFLRQGAESLGIEYIDIVLHGGEPLMQPKDQFIYLIEIFKENLSKFNVSFSMQTNASLVTKKWIDLLNKYDVGVGVSIDGPQEYNDKYRIDHYNNGSYNQVIRGIKLLQDGLKNEPGCLTVINPEFSGKIIYRHLVDLGFKRLDFLFPDNNYEVPPAHKIEKYKEYLIEVFNEWVYDNNAEISIRKFKSIILQLMGKSPLIYGFGKHKKEKEKSHLLAIRSDGEICPTDELMSTDTSKITFAGKNVKNTILQEVLSDNIFQEIDQANEIAPDKCTKCCWYQACGGGNLVSRYSKEKRFNNHSIYCDALQEIYAHVTSYIIKFGIKKETITDVLFNKVTTL